MQNRILQTTLSIGALLAGLAIPASVALAHVKIIHVPAVLAAETIPNPPANEDEAAKWQGAKADWPHILRLRRANEPVPIAMPLPFERYVHVHVLVTYCEPEIVPPAPVGPDTFYNPVDQVYGGRIYFQKPAWDSANFLPQAGWSEHRELWTSKVAR